MYNMQHYLHNNHAGHPSTPPSNCFPAVDNADFEETPLSAHYHWQGAADDSPLTHSLLQQAIDKGWVFELDGKLQAAQQQFPLGGGVGQTGCCSLFWTNTQAGFGTTSLRFEG